MGIVAIDARVVTIIACPAKFGSPPKRRVITAELADTGIKVTIKITRKFSCGRLNSFNMATSINGMAINRTIVK